MTVQNPAAALSAAEPQGRTSEERRQKAPPPPETALRLSEVHASAPGKAIIVGEHAVVYGARAVAIPVRSMQMNVRLTPLPQSKRDKNGEPVLRALLGGRTVTPHLRGVLGDAFSILGIGPFPLELDGHSSVLIGAGLGSSASLCIVVLKAIAAAAKINISPAELAAAGNQLEKRFHGNPSGLDTAVVALEQPIAFTKGSSPVQLPVCQPPAGSWRFALLDSGERSSTLAMIQIAAPYFHGTLGEQRLRRFDELAELVRTGLAGGDPTRVATAMAHAGTYLSEAGVSGAKLDKLIVCAKAAGCLAAKPTGAGGGGCVLALLGADPGLAREQLNHLHTAVGMNRVFEVELP